MNNTESLQPDLFKQDETGKVTEIGGREIKPLREPGFDYFIKRRFEENPPKMYFKDRDFIYEKQKEWEEEHGRSASWEEDNLDIINSIINAKIDEENLHPTYQKAKIEEMKNKVTRNYGVWKEYLDEAEKDWNDETPKKRTYTGWLDDWEAEHEQ